MKKTAYAVWNHGGFGRRSRILPAHRTSPLGLCAVLLAACAPWAAAQAVDDARAGAARDIDRVLARLPKGADVGVCVVAVGGEATPTVWHARNADAPMKPASTIKLFTSAAAIEHLGPEFEFVTRVFVVDGELWVIGGGDPGLGDERLAALRGETPMSVLHRWREALKRRGIEAIDKIVIDDSMFDQQWRHEDWPVDQAQRWYQAPVGGVNFNDNCLDVTIEMTDAGVELTCVPPLPEAFIEHRLRRGGTHRPLIDRRPDSDVFVLSGTATHGGALTPISARRPATFFGYALKKTLEDGGIAVRHDVVRRDIDAAAWQSLGPVAIDRTPLRDVLWRSNTFSQNLFAECMLKALAAYPRRTGQLPKDRSADGGGALPAAQGSWPDGARVMRETLESLGLDMNGAVLRDGSGLSHENRVTARQMAMLLARMKRHPAADLFIGSLAEPRTDGTLRRRFRDPQYENRLRAKTGSIAGVSALAGYVERADGVTLAFAILSEGHAGRGKQVEEQIVRALLGEAAVAANEGR